MLNFEIKFTQNERMLLERILNRLVDKPTQYTKRERMIPPNKIKLEMDITIPDESDLRAIAKKVSLVK